MPELLKEPSIPEMQRKILARSLRICVTLLGRQWHRYLEGDQNCRRVRLTKALMGTWAPCSLRHTPVMILLLQTYNLFQKTMHEIQ